MRKATYFLIYLFGALGIFTSLFFYFQPNHLGSAIESSLPGLYNFLLYYFIVSGAISFLIVALGGAMCVAKKASFRDLCLGLLLNLISLGCYLFFGILN